MSVKTLKTLAWDINEANQRLEQDFSPEYWAFLIGQIHYQEVTFEKAAQQIIFAEYIPLKNLVGEVLTRISRGAIAVTRCQVCQRYCDMNKEDGIFGDSHNLERFICKGCARTLSAWDFYHQHLKVE